MGEKQTGGPAFPISPRGEHTFYPTVTHDGMSLRDWFAGHALAGLLGNTNRDGTSAQFARDAYRAADAMLAARDAEGR